MFNNRLRNPAAEPNVKMPQRFEHSILRFRNCVRSYYWPLDLLSITETAFYLHGLTSISGWKLIIRCKLSDEIIYPFPNSNGCTIEVWDKLFYRILYWTCDHSFMLELKLIHGPWSRRWAGNRTVRSLIKYTYVKKKCCWQLIPNSQKNCCVYSFWNLSGAWYHIFTKIFWKKYFWNGKREIKSLASSFHLSN